MLQKLSPAVIGVTVGLLAVLGIVLFFLMGGGSPDPGAYPSWVRALFRSQIAIALWFLFALACWPGFGGALVLDGLVRSTLGLFVAACVIQFMFYFVVSFALATWARERNILPLGQRRRSLATEQFSSFLAKWYDAELGEHQDQIKFWLDTAAKYCAGGDTKRAFRTMCEGISADQEDYGFGLPTEMYADLVSLGESLRIPSDVYHPLAPSRTSSGR